MKNTDSTQEGDGIDGEPKGPPYETARESLERDTEMTFLRGSGPGGQHRNKVETGVRLRHIPSGIEVTATDNRSQGRNREAAFERLRAKLEEMNEPLVPRIPTKVPRGVKRERFEGKRKLSRKKALRQSPGPME